jgi:hypothetical protein
MNSLRGAIASVVVACAFAGSANAAAMALPKRCFTTFPEQRVTGALATGATATIREWSANCIGLFTASGGAGNVVLQVKSGAEWVLVNRGASVTVQQLPPGSYRLSVANLSAVRITYNVRYRVSGG